MKQLWVAVPLALLLAGCAQTVAEPTPESILNNLPSVGQLSGTPLATVQPAPSPEAAQVAQGRALYQEYCAACHGADLEGEAEWQRPNADGTFRAPPHDASGHTWHHGDAVLLEAIALGGERLTAAWAGSSGMPAFGETLSQEEMVAILAFIKQSWPDDIREMQWEVTVRQGNVQQEE
jgi:mono/diheme cytochrome c family protein